MRTLDPATPEAPAPMHQSPRCGARTRSGPPCKAPAVGTRRRCRMHGGAPGTGAPRGNTNALKHGLYTNEAMAQRKWIAALTRESKGLLREIWGVG